MLKKFLVVILLLGFGLSVAAAQEDAPTCDVAALSSGYTETLAAAATVEDLEAIHTQLANDIANCNGLSFTGSGNQALGPLELEGVYVMEYGYTEGVNIFLIQVTRVDGSESFPPIVSGSTGPSNSGTLETDGGKYLISVQGLGDWHFNLTKVE